MELIGNENDRYGDGKLLSIKTGIPKSTISYWRHRKNQDPSYNPLYKETNLDRKVFTKEEEITNYILENVTKQELLFTNYDFKILIMEAFNEKYMFEDDYDKIPKFNASEGFITDFKNRNNFVSRRLHLARRPLARNFDDIFASQMNESFKTVKPCYIINIDDTSWEFIPKI